GGGRRTRRRAEIDGAHRSPGSGPRRGAPGLARGRRIRLGPAQFGVAPPRRGVVAGLPAGHPRGLSPPRPPVLPLLGRAAGRGLAVGASRSTARTARWQPRRESTTGSPRQSSPVTRGGDGPRWPRTPASTPSARDRAPAVI